LFRFDALSQAGGGGGIHTINPEAQDSVAYSHISLYTLLDMDNKEECCA
jgi:hypothetical protein